ncbi:MAG: DNA-3-methyladenine glycosylase family protein [Coriobacteriales bacterium]|jgi:DNA-3-methyladenine glycosylase II
MPIIRQDSDEVRYLCERDWRLSHLISRLGDLEYRRAGSAFEALSHSIVEQMLSMKASAGIESRIRGACGGKISPDAVAALSVGELRECGISTRKAESLRALAEYAGGNDLEQLCGAPEDEIRSELMALPGIGRWTCDMFLLFYAGRPDVLPVEDGALRQSFEWLYCAPLGDPAVRQVVCSLWRPYSSYAVRYLYRALNKGLVKQGPPKGVLW